MKSDKKSDILNQYSILVDKVIITLIVSILEIIIQIGGNDMYLNKLQDTEKSLFLDAAILLSDSDGNMSDQEKEIILQLCEEMQIKPAFSSSRQLEVVLREMSLISDLKTKKIIVFELAGVILADSVFDKGEKKLIIQIAESLSLDRAFAFQAVSLVKAISGLYELVAQMIESV